MNPLEKRVMDIVIENHNKLLSKIEDAIGLLRMIEKDNIEETKPKVADHLFKTLNKEWREQQAWLGNLKANNTK